MSAKGFKLGLSTVAALRQAAVSPEPKRSVPRADGYIYLVQVRSHPLATKLGRAKCWDKRRPAYSKWNLSDGNGIISECVFAIVGKQPLFKIETILLQAASKLFDQYRGREWFSADISDLRPVAEKALHAHGIQFQRL